MTDFSEAAQWYSARGWRVIPLHRVGGSMKMCSCQRGGNCSSAGKHPKDNEWQKKPRMSGADIQETWDSSAPPNLGIATGSESGIWVLDIDPKNGGMEAMAELVAAHGPLPETFVAQTGSGGYHYFFTMPDFDLRNSVEKIGTGIDVRANGGQVVAAPSVTDKGPYTVISWAEPVAAPQWLIDLLPRHQDPATPIVTAQELPKVIDLDEGTRHRFDLYAQRAIDSETRRLDQLGALRTARPEDYRGEPWNHTLFEVSCALIEFANSPWTSYSIADAHSDVLSHSPRDVGFDDFIIEKTFNSAHDKVGAKARPQPEDRHNDPDPMFTNPEVRQVNPTEGGGPETTPVARRAFGRFFYETPRGGKEPLYVEMANAVFELGPVGWGRDEDFWSFKDGVWQPDREVVRFRLVELLGNSYRLNHTSNVEDIVRYRAHRVTGEPLMSLINFKNGMLDWATGELAPHDPDLLSTVQLGTTWDPTAQCPTFEAFLSDVLRPDYVDLAWEMIGYLMFSGNPLQVAFMFYGTGSNGKGTLMRVLADLLGHHNIASESLDDLNQNRFSSINLFGRIANLAGDIDATYQESTASFKKLTGEDRIAGERKFGQRFEFNSWAVPVFSANKFPGSADVTDGYLRRWIILHFHKHFGAGQKILSYSDRLAEELPGIANHAVSALRTLMARGTFDPQGEALGGKEEFAQAIDQVRQWLSSGEVQGNPDSWITADALYSVYRSWAIGAGNSPLKTSEFSQRLANIGYPTRSIVGRVEHQGLSVAQRTHAWASELYDTTKED